MTHCVSHVGTTDDTSLMIIRRCCSGHSWVTDKRRRREGKGEAQDTERKEQDCGSRGKVAWTVPRAQELIRQRTRIVCCMQEDVGWRSSHADPSRNLLLL